MVQIEVLEDGEQALLYSYSGQVTQIHGPKRLCLFMSHLRRLQRYIAGSDEYMRIEYKNGEIVHKRGPCIEFLNDLHTTKILVEKCFCLDANQAIIIYQSENPKNDFKYTRRIVFGPGIYMIEPHEWVHEFSWHGVDDKNKTRYKKDTFKFKILNSAPNQLYYNVDEVRTADDALVKIKLMIFYELKDVNLMLNNSKDPIGDFINCSSADVISFCSKRTYMDFIGNCHKLNDLDQFFKLSERAKQIGFEISKVVFRGYFASPQLQAMHDISIKTRTNLKLQLESENQNQESLCLNLTNQIKRLKEEQDLELEKCKHKSEMNKINRINELKLKLNEEYDRIDLHTRVELQKLNEKDKLNEIEFENLKNLSKLQVNLTDYLLSTIKKFEKTIQITRQSNDEKCNFHLHE